MGTQHDLSARLYAALREQGYATLRSYLDRHVGATYREMAKLFGVPAMVITTIQRWEAEKEEDLDDYVCDSLVRIIREHVKRGWGKGVNCEFNRAKAWAIWYSQVTRAGEDEQMGDMIRPVWEELIRSSPADDWVPIDTDDQHIVRAFECGWRRSV